MVPFTLTVSLKSGWGFRHRTETEGVKVPFATITTIPNIQTALFIQPTAIGTVYEDLGGVHGGFKFMRYQPHIRCNIAYTPWPSAYCPPHVPLFTSATLHLLSVLLSHFQRTRTRAISFSFRIVGQPFLAANPEDLIVQETGLISTTRLMDG